MKKYRIVYWLGSMTTECFVKANDMESAKRKFLREHGEDTVIFCIERLE